MSEPNKPNGHAAHCGDFPCATCEKERASLEKRVWLLEVRMAELVRRLGGESQ